MKKVTSIFLLIISISDAMAEWVPVRSDKKQTTYIEYSTIKLSGDTRKVWVLEKYIQPEKLVDIYYSSSMTQFELNCKDESFNIIASTYYDKSGNVMYNLENEQQHWDPVAPGTKGEFIWQLVCNRKL